MPHSKILRRLRERKTNYRRRGTMLMGRRDFVTIHVTNENVQVQIHTPDMTGDKIVASGHSRNLLSRGWKGSRKSIPASYLTGYLVGLKAVKKGAKEAIMYAGTKRYTERMSAALKGVVDAGLNVPVDPDTFPPEERVNGEHLSVKNDVTGTKEAISGEMR